MKTLNTPNCAYKSHLMSEYDAREISQWHYAEPYSIYSFEPTADTILELLDGSYQAVTSEYGGLVGYYCLGKNARIGGEEFTHPLYADESLVDIGLGMRPDLTGHGKGLGFVKACLSKASTLVRKKEFRLSVASFNQRAIKVYERAGFNRIGVISAKDCHKIFNFIIMAR